MFVEVWLKARPLKSKLVVPAGALRNGYLFIAGTENRLERRKVDVGYRGDGFAVVKKGLEPGARVVVSDLIAPSTGMLLQQQPDDDLQAALAKMAAAGENGQ